MFLAPELEGSFHDLTFEFCALAGVIIRQAERRWGFGRDRLFHRCSLADGDERSAFILVIPANAEGRGVQFFFAIHDKPVKMVAMTQLQAGKPPAVQEPFHGKRVPIIEVADEFDRLCGGRGAIEVDRLERAFGGVVRTV